MQYEANYLIDLFKKYNLKINDKTPDLTTDEIRRTKKYSLVKSNEILLWLQKHSTVEKLWCKLHNNMLPK